MAEMKRRHSGTGPVGDQLADNVADLRRQRRMTTTQLAQAVSDLGVPMTASTVTKIETQGRRVFVDELVALAIALNVSPVTLMLPGRNPRNPVGVTPTKSMPWRRAWRWMHASAPLPDSEEEDEFGEFVNWLALNRPYMGEAEFRRTFLGPATGAQEDADRFMSTTEEDDDDGPDD